MSKNNQVVKLSNPQRSAPERESGTPLIPAIVNNKWLKPAPKFFFSHHPFDWEFVEGEGFLPKLCQHNLVPSCNGVGSNKKSGEPISKHLETRLLGEGKVIIKNDDSRLGRHNPFLAFYETEEGKKWWVFWATEVTLIPGRAPIWKPNIEEWHDFKKTVRDNICEPMTEEAYMVIAEQLQSKIDSLAQRIAMSPTKNNVLEDKFAELNSTKQKMIDAWAEVCKNQPEEPVAIKPSRSDEGEKVIIKPKR